MAISFHVLRSSGAFTAEHLKILNSTLDETARDCSSRLIVGDVDVVVMNVPWNTIPRIGINGYSYDAHQVVLFLDVAHAHLKRHLRRCVGSILAHELHHCARANARGGSHSTTYGGSLVAEGLACCFEEEVGHPTPFYAVECRGEPLRAFSKRAKNHARTDRSDMPGHWQKWMFGGAPEDTEFPYQCGYSTGYALVKHWLVTEGMKASDAAGVDETVILDLWCNDEIDPFENC